MLIRIRNIALILGLFLIPSIHSMGVIDLDNFSDSSDNNVSCESDEQCVYTSIIDEPWPNDTGEITDEEESDSDSSENVESTLKLLAPLLQKNAGTKITFNVRDIQSGFSNYGAGYRIGSIPDKEVRVKRQIDSTVQVPNNNVVQNNEQTFLNTSGNGNNTTNTDGQVAIQNNTLPNSNVLFNNDSVSHEPNSSTAVEANTEKTVTDNRVLTKVIDSNDSLVTISESSKELKNLGDNALSANKSYILKNPNISPNEQNENSNKKSLSSTTISKIQRLLSNFLNNIGNNPLKNKSTNDNSNTPIVVYYTCNCGVSEAREPSDEDLGNILNTRRSTFTNIDHSDVANNLNSPIIDISNKLAKLNAKGKKYIFKKVNDANLSYWKSLLSILSNTSSVELTSDNTNGLNTNTKPFLKATSLNDRQINKNILNSQSNESVDPPIDISLNSDDGTKKPLQHNNITSKATQIDQGLNNIQNNVNNLATNQNNPQDIQQQPQHIQNGNSRKRRSTPRNLIHTPYQVKNRRKKRQVDGDLTEMIRNAYPFSHHAFHHLDRPFPHHAFHHLNSPLFPHHAFHHLNRPLYFSNHRKALRHLINSNYWLQTFGEDNMSTEDKPSGYNNKEVVEKRDTGESRKVVDADESESGIDDDDDNKSGDDVDTSTSLPKRFNFTVKVSLK